VDQLGIDRFGLIGLSGGGPYVLACAFRLPDRVVAGAVIGSVAPSRGPEAAEGGPVSLTARFNALLGTLRAPLGVGLWAFVWVVRPLASQAFELYKQLSPEGDREVFASPGMKEMFIDDLLRASRRQLAAPIHDLVLFGRDWGFSPRDITVPIALWQGAEDYVVPLEHGRHLAELLPDAELQVMPRGAHLANLGLGGELLDSILCHWPSEPTESDADAS